MIDAIILYGTSDLQLQMLTIYITSMLKVESGKRKMQNKRLNTQKYNLKAKS